METTEKIETETMSLMDKKANDLTVGDVLKANLIVTAAIVAVPIVVGGTVTGVKKLAALYQERKARKLDSTETTDTE
jgi:hypothetical protein